MRPVPTKAIFCDILVSVKGVVLFLLLQSRERAVAAGEDGVSLQLHDFLFIIAELHIEVSRAATHGAGKD